MFGVKSKLEREIWLQKLSSDGKWILSPDAIRQSASKILERPSDATAEEPDWIIDARWLIIL